MKRLVILLLFSTVLWVSVLSGGCGVIGFLASPTFHEQKVPAEFDLRAYADRKVLVFVDEVSGANLGMRFRRQIAGAMENYLLARVKIDKENLVSSAGIENLRGTRDNFSLMTPAEAGRELGAGLVLYVLVEDYDLYGMTEESYYTGSLYSRCVLFDSESGRILWPAAKHGHVVEAIVELELQREAAQERLVSATALSITNKLFDCPYDESKVGDIKDEGYNW